MIKTFQHLQRLCSKDEIETRRETVVRSGGGEAVKTWTTLARGELPALAMKCRRQSLKSEEAIAAGVTSGKRTWNLKFYYDPQIDKRDRVYFTDGTAIEAEVVTPSYQHDSQLSYWECLVTEFGPGKR